MWDHQQPQLAVPCPPGDGCEYLQAVFDVVDVGLYLIGEEGFVQHVNQAAAEMAREEVSALRQVRPGEALHCVEALGGSRVCGQGPKCSGCAIRAAFAEALHSGRALRNVETLQTFLRDGREATRWLSLGAAPVILAERRHVVLSVTDITRHKHLEEAAAAADRNLEQAIRRANELALEAALSNAAKSEFLASMSHEIRTPLNGVLGMTRFLLESDLSQEQREYADTVRVSAEALLSLINGILDLSKIEAGKLELESITFDLRALADEVMDVLSLAARQKRLEFACVIDPAVPTLVRGDPGRLRQILLNLVNNAIKFTPRGEVVVRVTLDAVRPQEVRLRFAVSDTGIGIAPEALSMLFQPFAQAESATPRQFGGTGLGLAISKRLVELMNGRISATSEPGKGSTFSFTVGLAPAGPADHQAPWAMEDLCGTRALIVDAHPASREMLRTHLESWGGGCQEASDAAGALEQLRCAAQEKVLFDIALIDASIPGQDGFALGAEIKADPRWRDIVLVLMTAAGLRGEAARAREIGFAAYLPKPPNRARLRASLEAALGLSRQAAPGATPELVTERRIAEQQRQDVRILLADDNLVNQKVALKMLQRLGYQAECVADGQAAVEAVQNAAYDLILMDCQMPRLDGFAAAAAIREHEDSGRYTPIIAMTAHALQGDRERCLAAGMDDYLAKPVDQGELAKAIERQLATPAHDRRRLREAGAEEPPAF